MPRQTPFNALVLTEPYGYVIKPVDTRELKAVIDIALYKHQAEKRLRKTQERLLRAQRLAKLGTWEQDDLATGEIEASDEACKILGIEREGSAFISHDEILARVHPEDRASVLMALRKTATEGSMLHIEHRTNHTADQSERFVRQYGEIVREQTRNSTRLLGAVQDITEYRSLEEQLRRAQKLEAIGRLAGGVAHDFNNLLVVINGYSRLILSKLHSQDPLYSFAEQILKAGERAAGLTRQLLTFSGRRSSQLKAVNLNALIGDLETMLRCF